MNKKTLLIIILAVTLVLVVIFVGFFVMWSKLSAVSTETKSETKEAVQEEDAKKMIGQTFPLETFIVNLADEGAKRYLRITMELELSDAKLEGEINKRLPQIRDRILMILPTKTVEGVRTVEGKISLRDEIMIELNGLLVEGTISNLYFVEFVIQ